MPSMDGVKSLLETIEKIEPEVDTSRGYRVALAHLLQALREMQLLSTASVKQNRAPLVDQGCVPPLLRCMHRWSSNETVVASVCIILWNLSACNENQPKLLKEGCVVVLRGIIAAPRPLLEGVANALQTLVWLSFCKANQIKMVDNGLVEDLLGLCANMMRGDCDDEVLHQETTERGRDSLGFGSKQQYNYREITTEVSHGHMDRIKLEIVCTAVRVIHNLASNPTNKVSMLVVWGVLNPLISMVSHPHPNDDEGRLRLIALRALASLANASEKAADELMNSSLLPTALAVIAEIDEPCDDQYVRKRREELSEKAVNTIANLCFRHIDTHRALFQKHRVVEAFQPLRWSKTGYVQLRASMTLADLIGSEEEFSEYALAQIVEVLRNAIDGTLFCGYRWDAKSPLLSLLRLSKYAPNVGKLAGSAAVVVLLNRIVSESDKEEENRTLALDVLREIYKIRPSQEFLDMHSLGSCELRRDFAVSDVKFESFAPSSIRPKDTNQIIYTIKVKCYDRSGWLVARDYLEIMGLEQKTARARGRMPDFPRGGGAKMLFGFKEEVLEERMHALEDWMRALVVRTHQNPELQRWVQDFLERDKNNTEPGK